MYTVNAQRRSYRNIVVACSLNILKATTGVGTIFRDRTFKCYEQVRTLQCFRCYAFGHMANRCTNKISCRNCAGEHISTECPDQTGEPKCANCIVYKRPHQHRVTYEMCPTRIARINGLIDSFGSKN